MHFEVRFVDLPALARLFSDTLLTTFYSITAKEFSGGFFLLRIGPAGLSLEISKCRLWCYPCHVKIGALIPVKAFAGAKQRLSSRLSLPEREQLMRAMVHDVLSEISQARGVHETFVVTASPDVARWVSRFGAGIIRESSETGETDAVHFALNEMKQRGIDAALVLPGDVPLVRASDVEHLLARVKAESGRRPFAVLVPSHDRMGTNALLLSPPDIIRLRFGHDSFCHHLDQVVRQRLEILIVENDRIALDIDEPRDLERLLPQLKSGKTHERLIVMKDSGSTFFRDVG